MRNKLKHDDFYLRLGKKIAELRRNKGYTQESFANKIGISYGYYTQIEAPNVIKKMSLEVLLDIAEGLSVNIKDLI